MCKYSIWRLLFSQDLKNPSYLKTLNKSRGLLVKKFSFPPKSITTQDTQQTGEVTWAATALNCCPQSWKKMRAGYFCCYRPVFSTASEPMLPFIWGQNKPVQYRPVFLAQVYQRDTQHSDCLSEAACKHRAWKLWLLQPLLIYFKFWYLGRLFSLWDTVIMQSV